jgi:hypothetical protein
MSDFVSLPRTSSARRCRIVVLELAVMDEQAFRTARPAI